MSVKTDNTYLFEYKIILNTASSNAMMKISKRHLATDNIYFLKFFLLSHRTSR